MSDQFLKQLCEIWPESRSIAFGSAETVFSLADLRKDVGGWLRPVEPASQKRWALWFEDSYHFTAALLALFLAGKEAVISDNARVATFQELADEGHFEGVLTDQPVEFERSIPIVTFPGTAEILRRSVPDDREAILWFFTSGSSGRPKPIFKRFEQISREAGVVRERLGREYANSEVVSTVTHQHFYGFIWRVFVPLLCGAPFAQFMLRTPDAVLAACSSKRVLVTSPALLKRMQGTPAKEGFRLIVSAGGTLPEDAADNCEALLGCRPTDLFGTSESGAIAIRVASGAATPWEPLPSLEIKADGDGRMLLRSPYLNPDAVDSAGWFKGDDRIEVLPDHSFRLLGRLDRIIKIEEKRVSLTEVERCLELLPEVKEAAVVMLERGNRVEIGAVLVLNPAGQAELGRQSIGSFSIALRRSLQAHLEAVAIPRRIRIVDAIPTNTQGKRVAAEIAGLFE